MPGEIIKEILSEIKNKIPRVKSLKVTDVRIGLGYTGVLLNNGNAGVCHTLSSELLCCQKNIRAGELASSSALKLAELASSWNLYEAIVGIATINALSQIILEKGYEQYLFKEGVDFIDQITIEKQDTVVLVGYIKPFISKLKEKAKTVYILERDPRVGENTLPDSAGEEIIPKANIVIVTGSTIINGTLDRILELSRNANEIGVVGPTASMIPEPLFKRGVSITGGIKVIDAKKLLQIISEGGGVPKFKTTCKQIVIRSYYH